MWNIGSASQTRSSDVMRSFHAALHQGRTTASCVSRQPFGLAVVPDVKRISATSRTRAIERSFNTYDSSTSAAFAS